MTTVRKTVRRTVRAALAGLLLLGVVAAAGAVVAPARAESNAVLDWYFVSHGAHARSSCSAQGARLLHRYHGLWIGPARGKTVYLTFDAGWEQGGTMRRLLDTLERAHVTATFFLTGQYIRDNPGLVRRIAREGHTVGDHTFSHPHMTALAGRPRAFAQQITATARLYRKTTGERMSGFFRAPYGTYSARVLQLVRRLGYTSVFWSFAHVDYEEGAQPPVSVTRSRIINAAAPGTLYLLHASSTSNVAALPGALHWLKRHGYAFGTLDELR